MNAACICLTFCTASPQKLVRIAFPRRLTYPTDQTETEKYYMTKFLKKIERYKDYFSIL